MKYVILVIVTTFSVVYSGPNQVRVEMKNDTISYQFPDSCTALHCYRGMIQNVGVFNPQTQQIISSIEIDTISE